MRILKVFCLISALAVILSVSAFAAAPTIVTQPQNAYVSSDVSYPVYVNFSVLASGENLSYQWQLIDTDGAWRNAEVSSATSANLRVPLYSSSMNGHRLFRVIVSNTEGTVVSETVSVSVGAFVLDSLPQFLSFVSDTANSIFSWARDACNCIVQQPLLLFTVGFLALGGCIAVVSRLLARS